MLNLLDTEEPSDNSLKPDGEYIPRLVFLDSNGKFCSWQLLYPPSLVFYALC